MNRTDVAPTLVMRWSRSKWFGTLICLVVFVSPASLHSAGTGRIGVLELTNQAGITDVEANYLTDKVRDAASRVLGSAGYSVMTRESIKVMLPAGTDLATCASGECEVEIGRQIGAEYIVTGEILKFSGELRANIKVHHSESGRFVGSRSAEGIRLKEIERSIVSSAEELFAVVANERAVAQPPMPRVGGGPAPATTPDPELARRMREADDKAKAQEAVRLQEQEAGKREAEANRAMLDSDYQQVKQAHDNASLSAAGKQAAYGYFIEKWPSDTRYTPTVRGWMKTFGDMVLIPGGTFQMGCVPGDTQCDDDEKPRHTERVDPFYADVHEVTNAEYRECVASGSCTAIDEADCYKWNGQEWAKGGALGSEFKSDNQPVVCVNWTQATDYCATKGKRLPTEAEFEYALRGGRDGDKFPWGDSDNPPSGYGNYADETGAKRNNWTRNASNIFMGYDDGYATTAPVCSFSRNPYGLCDISGNVWEWTSDGYSTNYSSDRGIDRRVLRGGSWLSSPRFARASRRAGDFPTVRLDFDGVRCFRDGS